MKEKLERLRHLLLLIHPDANIGHSLFDINNEMIDRCANEYDEQNSFPLCEYCETRNAIAEALTIVTKLERTKGA